MEKLGRSQFMIIALLIASLGYVAYESVYAATFDLTWTNHIQYDDNGINSTIWHLDYTTGMVTQDESQ